MKLIKITLMFTLLFASFSFSSFDAYDYKKAWKEIETSIQQGLPKSALKKVDELYLVAKSEENVEQQIKATIYRTNLVLNTEELGLESVITTLDKRIAEAKSPTKEMLLSISAELMANYLQNQYHVISQRTVVEGERGNDIRTWAPNHYKDYISGQYLASVSSDLYEYKTKDYKDLLEDRKNTEYDLRPSLQELLVDRALKYFSRRDYRAINPTFVFKIDDKKYYSRVDSFIDIEIKTDHNDSKVFQVLKLYQKELTHLLENGNSKVLANYDKKRIDFVRSFAEIANNDVEYLSGLVSGASYFSGELKNEYLISIAQYYMNTQQYEKALAQIEEIKKGKVSDSINAQISNIEKSIYQKTLHLIGEQVVPKGKAFEMLVQAKNISKVYFNLVELEDKRFTEIFSQRREDQLKLISSLPTVRSWTTKIELNGYGSTNQQIDVEGLDYGKYFLIASNQERLNDDSGAFVFTSFHVSDIAYTSYMENGNKQLLVRDRKTGEPMKKVSVAVNERRYNNNERKYEYIEYQKAKTNGDGFVSVSAPKNRSISYVLSKGEDVLDLEANDYFYRDNNKRKKRKTTEIFTDRAIYRPGQTVHFKTVSLNITKDGVPSIDTGEKLAVMLFDANGQEVETIDLVSNEFGSASGSFILPIGQLTGMFSIRSNTGYKSIRVEEYKRPKFEVNVNDQKHSVILGETVEINGNATALSGSPVSNGQVVYSITKNTYYGWWSWYRKIPSTSEVIKQGNLETDEKGAFIFSFDTKIKNDDELSSNPTYSYTIKVDVTDVAGETRSTTKVLSVSALPYSYNLSLEDVMEKNSLKSITIKAMNTENVAQESKAVLKITELVQPKAYKKRHSWSAMLNEGDNNRLYTQKSELENYPIKEIVHEEEILISKDGYDLNIAQYVEGGKAYKVELISVSKFSGYAVTAVDYVAVAEVAKNSYPTLKLLYVNPSSKTGRVGEKYEVELGTSDKELVVYYSIMRDNKVLEKGLVDVDNTHTLCYIPKKEDKGGITLFLDYVKYNTYKRESHNIEIPWNDKKLDVQLLTKRDKVLPGSNEEWIIKLTGKNKEQQAIEMLATMYDSSLDQFVGHNYDFNPFPSHYANQNSQFFGFQNAVSGSLRYQWNRIKNQSVNVPLIPILRGLGMANLQSGMHIGNGNIRIRGSRSAESSVYTDGVRMRKSKAPASPEMVEADQMMDETEVIGYGVSTKKESTESSSNTAPEISIRKNLKESVFFFPHLKTDKDGNTLLSFKMNEALTKWKMLTFSHDKDLNYGVMSHEIRTQKDLMITANAPRFLREGDHINFPATISNLSDKSLVVKAKLELIDPETGKVLNEDFEFENDEQILNIESGISSRVDWSIVVPDDYKKLIKYKVIAYTDEHSDGEEDILPVLTNKVLVTESKVISVKGNEKKDFVFSELANTSSTATPHRYTFEFTSNPIWYAVQALPYMMESSRESSEQIFNRLYANEMASYLVGQNPKLKAVFEVWKNKDTDALLSNLEKNEELKSALLSETPWVRSAKNESEQKQRIALLFDFNKMSNELTNSIEKLRQSQRASGGFSWFPGGRENVYITQNIVAGFLHLQRLGIIDKEDPRFNDIISKALRFIDEQVVVRHEKLKERTKKYGGDLSKDNLDRLSIHYLYLRSFSGLSSVPQSSKEAFDYYFGQAEKYWLGKGLMSEAMIGITMTRKENKVSDQIQASLKERSFYSEDLGRYWNQGNGFNWYELPIESHSLLIEFFTEKGEDQKFLDDAKIWLIKNKQTNHWKTTKATSLAIYALLMQGDGTMSSWIDENNKADITIGSEKFNQDDAQAGTGYVKKIYTRKDITPSLANISVQNNNKNVAFGAAYYQYFEEISAVEDFVSTPLKVDRELYISKKTDSGEKLFLVEDSEVRIGDKLTARITIKADRNMTYVHLKDLRSSAVEPVNVLSGYKWKSGIGYYESTRDLASHFFISQLNKGTYVFEYDVRAVYKGEFTGGMTTLQCMYAPEFLSHSNGNNLEVVE